MYIISAPMLKTIRGIACIAPKDVSGTAGPGSAATGSGFIVGGTAAGAGLTAGTAVEGAAVGSGASFFPNSDANINEGTVDEFAKL
jgi:hypothetical protein